MSDAAPAGWHPDPRGRHEHRYWDGTQWTDHVADAGVMATDPVAEVTPVAAPVGPSMVNLPAITPERPEPEPEPEPEPTAVQPEPEPVRAEPEPEPAASGPDLASEESATIPPSEPLAGPVHERSPDLAALLSVVAPGTGHVYLGRAGGLAYGLIGATLIAVVLSYFSFLLFIVGLVIWAGAAAFALVDLRGGLAGIREARFSAQMTGWILVAAGGVILVALLVLPWYHVNVDVSSKLAGVNASQSSNFTGFQSFSVIDLILAAVAIASIVAGLAALGKGPISSDELPPAMPAIIAGGALLGLVLTFFRLFVDVVPGFGDLGPAGSIDISVGRGPGGLLTAAGLIAILVAGVSALTGAQRHTESVATA